MAIEVVMPRLGWTMETGTVAEWLKKDGDAVQAGEVIFTVDSDKAVQEVEALDSGILRIPPDAPPVGSAVPVGSVLAYLVAPGEAAMPTPGEAAVRAPADEERTPTPGPDPELGLDAPATPTVVVDDGPASLDVPAKPTVAASNGRVPDGDGVGAVASPRARRVAGELGVDWAAATGTGRTGRIVERDVRALADQANLAARARVTPLARRLAEGTGIDLAALETGRPGQRITRVDVEAAARGGQEGQPEAAEPALSRGRRTPLSHIRRITAQRMAQSAGATAPVTLTTDANATELVTVRERIKAALTGSDLRVPTYNDLLTRLVALALLQQPWMNCSLEDDAIVQHEGVHMGLAVDTERGLFVPVIRDAHLKSIQQIATDSARLVDVTRTGRAGADDLRGGTFTISNLGMYEIDAFTPIINLPECAILGVGRIVARPIVVDEETEEIAVRKMMALSLTFDHRVVDGAPAARFLQQVKRWVEQPYAWLIQ
jgi:pyruvate dehydrogenase E2 component (dihydrolipoamide acetyltransferase)